MKKIHHLLDHVTVKVGLNTMYQVIGRFVTAATGLITMRLINNSIGLEGFGNFQIVLTYVTLFWMLTDFGLNAVVVQEMTIAPEKENKLFGSLITLRTLLSLILGLISSIALFFLPYTWEIKSAIFLGMITFITQGISGATHGLFQNRLRYELLLISNLIGSVVYIASIMYVLNTGPTVFRLISCFVMGQILMCASSIYLADRISRFHFNRNVKLLKDLAIATLPFGLSLLFNLGNFKVDSFLLSVLALPDQTNAAAVGIYNTAYKFFEFALIMPTFMMNSLYPILIASYEKSFTEFKKVFRYSMATLFGVGAFASIAGIIASPWLIMLVADDNSEFDPAVKVLRVLFMQLLIFFMSSFLMWTILTFKKQTVLVKIYGLAFLTNLGLNLIFIPKFSYFGAAVTTGVSELLILVILAFYVLKYWKEHKLSSAHGK